MENTSQTRLKISRILKSTLVLKQLDGNDFFIATSKAIVISIQKLVIILHFLVLNDILDHQILEGLLEEYHSSRSNYGKTTSSQDNNSITIG